MIDERWRAAWSVYDSACALPADKRRAFVESELEDPALRGKILQMLDRQDARATLDPGPDVSGSDPLGGCESGPIPSEGAAWPYVGKTIDRFLITAPLGRGGMGDVYTARDLELNRSVALKFVSAASIGT